MSSCNLCLSLRCSSNNKVFQILASSTWLSTQHPHTFLQEDTHRVPLKSISFHRTGCRCTYFSDDESALFSSISQPSSERPSAHARHLSSEEQINQEQEECAQILEVFSSFSRFWFSAFEYSIIKYSSSINIFESTAILIRYDLIPKNIIFRIKFGKSSKKSRCWVT